MLISKLNKKAFTQFAKKWEKTRPPARPSQGEIRVYNQMIKNLSPKIKTALILGATPELRDLLSRQKIKVSLVDFNINMIKAMSLLIKSKTKEKIFLADWDKKFTDLKFDLIVGDTALNMLSWADWSKTFKNIKEMLKKDGFALMKIAFFNPKRKKTKSKNIIKKWREKKIGTSDMRWFLEMYSDYKTYNPQTMIDSKAKLIEEFKRSYRKGDLTKLEWQKLQIYDDKIVMTIPPYQKVNNLIKKYFKTVKIVPGKDFLYCRDIPIYLLKKK